MGPFDVARLRAAPRRSGPSDEPVPTRRCERRLRTGRRLHQSDLYNIGMQMLQQPDKITFLYSNNHEVRHVRMNQPHPAHVTPTWYGDSVGRYEGDTLVIDTVGIKIGPFA